MISEQSVTKKLDQYNILIFTRHPTDTLNESLGICLFIENVLRFGAAHVSTSTSHHSDSGNNLGKFMSHLNTFTAGVKIQSSLFNELPASLCGV